MKYEVYEFRNNQWQHVITETFNAQIKKGDIIWLNDNECEVVKVILTPGEITGRIYIFTN